MGYERLTPAARANVDLLLTAHPHYELLLSKDVPAGTDAKLWAFLQAATWPDMVRPSVGPTKKPESITRFSNASWHYVNLPYIWPADAEKFAAVRLAAGGDLLTALANCRRVIPDYSRKEPDRAVQLAWLLHLIGDMHQPLHAVSMYSAGTMKGDQGGNLVAVRNGNSVVKLHSFWGGLMGGGDSMRFIQNIAADLKSNHIATADTSLPELQKAKTPDAWLQESFAAAVESAYLGGKLKWRLYDDWEKKDQLKLKAADFPALDPDYIINARALARKRAALAAVRLADLLNELLK